VLDSCNSWRTSTPVLLCKPKVHVWLQHYSPRDPDLKLAKLMISPLLHTYMVLLHTHNRQ
jgi:hypothetical protein